MQQGHSRPRVVERRPASQLGSDDDGHRQSLGCLHDRVGIRFLTYQMIADQIPDGF